MTKNQIRKARFAVSSYFALPGAGLTLCAVHIPTIQEQTGVDYATLGLLFMLAGLGGFLGMQILGYFIDHVGSKSTTRFGSLLTGFAVTTPAFTIDALTLGISLFILGLGLAATDIPVNSHALEVEEEHGKPIFNMFHAFWSIGGFIGAALGSLTLALGVDVRITLTGFGLFIALLGWAQGTWMLPDKPNTGHQDEASKKSSSKANRIVFRFIALAGLMAASGAIMEGIANDWSALYLRDILGTSEAVAAWALALFSIFMTVGRLLIDRLVAIKGRMFIVRYGSIFSALAIIGIMQPISVAQNLFFWALLGLFLSGVVPQIFAMAGRIGDPAHHGRNMSQVVGVAYLAALAGPSVIGILTIWLPLNFALGYSVVLGVFVFIATFSLGKLVTEVPVAVESKTR